MLKMCPFQPLFGGPKWGPEWVHFQCPEMVICPLAGDPQRGHRAYFKCQNVKSGPILPMSQMSLVHFGVPNGSQIASFRGSGFGPF